MRTTYVCEKCNVRFTAEGDPPNINKRHRCGEFMRIEEFDSGPSGESAA